MAQSWWEGLSPEQFSQQLPQEQGRMRRELHTKPVTRALEAQLWLEEQENMGIPTRRTGKKKPRIHSSTP